MGCRSHHEGEITTMLKPLISASLVASMSLSLGGCFLMTLERSGTRSDTPSPAPTYNSSSSNTEVGQAEMLQGNLGNVTSFSSRAPELSIRRSTGSAYVRIDALDGSARWWAMNALTVTGGLTHASLQPGAHLSFSSTTASVSGLRVSVLGCSGPARNNYTYDHPADRVDVDVMEGSEPNTNRMVFTAYFRNGSAMQSVQGSFEYEPR